MKRILSTIIAIIAICISTCFAQFRILPSGEVRLTTSAGSGGWDNTMITNVNSTNSKTYIVAYNNSHKAYVRGDGVFVGNGNLSISDSTKKENIQRIPNALDKVCLLNGVTYSFIQETTDNQKLIKRDMGVLAQEVQKIAPEAVDTLEDGCLAVSYNSLVGLLIEAVKELQQEVQELRTANILLKSNESNESNVQQFELSNNTIFETIQLHQNAPNPFNERTIVKCFIPQTIQKAQLCIYNMHGTQVQCLTITERNDVFIEIEANVLSAGIYSYVLLGDGVASEIKQMILTK